MATKKSVEEEIIVEGELSDVFKSVSNVLDINTYKNLSIDNDFYQITANYKDGSIKGEVLISFMSESEKTTKIKIRSTAADSKFAFMSSNEVIIEMFKECLKIITNVVLCNNNKIVDSDNINNKCQSSELTLVINRTAQWFAINPPVKIFIDDNKEYEIENGKSIEMPISYGVHNIKCSCGIRNKIIDINITQNTILNIKFNRMTGSIEVTSETAFLSKYNSSYDTTAETLSSSEIIKAPYNTLCVVGIVISGISLLLNFWGIVGIIGTVLSVAGLLDCQKRNENGKALAIIGIVIGIYSILYAIYILNKTLYY